ncbi:MAG: peptidoglycan-binding domain-containing protein [Desulfobacterales bacterium]
MKGERTSLLVRGIVIGSVLVFTGALAVFAQQSAGTMKQPATSDSQAQTMHGAKSQAGMHKGAMQSENMDSSMMQNSGKMHKMSKQQVKSVQTALNKEGYDLQEDGIMGKDTHNAIKDYQKKNQLKQTGKLDSETMSKLNVQ